MPRTDVIDAIDRLALERRRRNALKAAGVRPRLNGTTYSSAPHSAACACACGKPAYADGLCSRCHETAFYARRAERGESME